MKDPVKSNTDAIRAGVYGGTGTTGCELVKLLSAHPRVTLAFATSRDGAGQPLRSVDPAAPEVTLTHPDEADADRVDVAFLCLPHGASAPFAEKLSGGRSLVIDLSGDLRLVDRKAHEKHYGTPRSDELMSRVAFGLPELHRGHVREASVISNPGCYATATILALAPLARAGMLTGPVHVDAKSGVSGAGRAATATTHYLSASEDIRPYKPGRVHRHVPEMEQELDRVGAGSKHTIVFVPHLVPMERGILATCMVQGLELDMGKIRTAYEGLYGDEQFIRLLPDGEFARTRAAAHTNRAVISLHPVPETGWLVVASAIDNLGKGAAGQAVQNMNLRMGLDESAGLRV